MGTQVLNVDRTPGIWLRAGPLSLPIRKSGDQPDSISRTFCVESTFFLFLPRQLREEGRARNKGMCLGEGIIELPQRLSSASNVTAPTYPRLLCPVVKDIPPQAQASRPPQFIGSHTAFCGQPGMRNNRPFFVFSNSAAFAHVCQTGSRRHGVCDIACRRRTVDGLQFGGPSKCGSVFEQRGPQGHRCRRGAYKNWGEVALGSFVLTSPSVALRSPSYSRRPPSPTSCLVKWSSTRTFVTSLS